MSPIEPARSSDAVLPFSEASLLALLGDDFSHARISGATPLAQRSRNRLLRLSLDNAPCDRLILKLVRRANDPFWDHHVRREHRVLELLDRFWPGGAPRPFAAVFGGGWGFLLTEDVGGASLAEALEMTGASTDEHGGAVITPSAVAAPLGHSLDRLADLHASLRGNRLPFYRTCYCVDLDRISENSLRSRLRVARSRLLGALAAEEQAARAPYRAAERAYVAGVVQPLLRGPRQMIHNSLSPLNVVLGTAPRFVDWETMTLAAAELDIAELLRFPGAGLSWPQTDDCVRTAFGDQIDPGRLRAAALARAVDYAAANAKARDAAIEARDRAMEASCRSRRDWYLAELREVAEELQLGSALEVLIGREAPGD